MKRTKSAWLARGSAIALMVAGGIALSACSGSDGLTKAEEEALQERLEKAEDAAEDAEQRADAAEDDAEDAEKRADAAEDAAEDAEKRADEAEDDVTAANERADEEIRKEKQKTEDAHRGRGLLTALGAVHDGTNWAMPGNMASAGINDRETDIVLTASPLTGSTRKSGDFYTATLSRTAPGVNQPERKTVAYTDREKSRSFANHYASSIATNVGGTKANPRFGNSTWAPATTALTVQGSGTPAEVHTTSRGGHPSTRVATDPDPADLLVSSFSASVQGVSGSYGCYNSTTNTACKISVDATYTQETGTTDTHHELSTLTITAESGGTLYFDPGGGTISLLNVAKTGAPAVTDEEYVTFGWWRERPALADGTYMAAVFADVPSGKTYAIADGTGSAEYEGPAAGLYVDLQSDGSETTYESGEFTAKAILRATFGSGDNAGVEGDVTSFRTTHGTKNWHVRLRKDADGSAGSAEIVQAGTTSTGVWEANFLDRHDNVSATVDDQPIAVTGRFDASIANVRHIVGAFGAHRTTDPVPGS